MQPPHVSLSRPSLLAYVVTTCCWLAPWTSFTPHLFAYADEITIPKHDSLSDPALYALVDGGLTHIEHGGSDSGESEGYEPDFGYLDRSVIGRQAPEVDKLKNNEKMEKDIGPDETLYFVLEKNQMRLRRVVDVPLEALEAQETINASEESVGVEREADMHGGGADTKLKKRQDGASVWLTANTCLQPVPGDNKTDAFKDQPQLRMYVSTSSDNQKPGPGSTQNTITNTTGVPFDHGYLNFPLNTTSDVYIGISAPKLESDWFGSWHFELAASVDGPYHQYTGGDPFLYMVDTDSESTLFITYDLEKSSKDPEVKKWRDNNPFKMYAFTKDDWRIAGMEHSHCALREQFSVNNTRDFTIDSSITTKFSPQKYPKGQFHVKDLENGKTYNGFVVVEGGQEPLEVHGLEKIRGGGRVFQAFNWTTKVGKLPTSPASPYHDIY
jgi:calcium channel MID1